jgi:hypothetical protein
MTQLLGGTGEVLRGDREDTTPPPDRDGPAPEVSERDAPPATRHEEVVDPRRTFLDGTGELRGGPKPDQPAAGETIASDNGPSRMSPLEREYPLPRIGREDGAWDADGRLEAVQGQPVDDFLRDLAADRHDRYLEGRGTPELAKSQVGPVFSIALDRRSGDMYEGTNKMVPDEVPTSLHPVLQERLDQLALEGHADPEGYEYANGDRGMYPHFSTPGTHAEVQAVDRALRERDGSGVPVDSSHLGELTVYSRWLQGPDRGSDARCCPNCTALLGGIDSVSGFRQIDEMKR